MKPLKFSGTHQVDETRIAFHLRADEDISQRIQELLFVAVGLGHKETPELIKGQPQELWQEFWR